MPKKYELSSYKLISPIQSLKKENRGFEGIFKDIFDKHVAKMPHVLKILTSIRNILKSYTAVQKLYANP